MADFLIRTTADAAEPNGQPALMERASHVALITLNRPEVRNAVDAGLSQAVGELLEEAQADPGIRVVVVTGAGEAAFSAGADLKAASAGESIHAPGHPEWGFAGIVKHEIGKPIIAAVNGVALGGGAEIALSCDLVVASEKATFGFPEVKRGLIPAAGGLVRLQQALPLKIAMELVLTGEPITAAEAAHFGLVNKVVGAGTVLEESMRLATLIGDNAPLAVQASKRVMLGIVDGRRPAEDLGWALNREARRAIMGSRDAREGPLAFVEKRRPVWLGE